MKCESCHKAEASVHLKQVVDGKIKEVFLCQECAARKGMKSPEELADFLFGLSESLSAGAESPATVKRCPGCKLSFADFESKHRLGCPQCYETFRQELIPVIEDMQRAQTHIGKVPAGERSRKQVQELKAQLLQAVKVQDFESAAELRDRIKELEGT